MAINEEVFGRAVYMFVKSKGFDVDVNQIDYSIIEEHVSQEFFKRFENQNDMVEFAGLYLTLLKIDDNEDPMVTIGKVTWFLEHELNRSFIGDVDFDLVDQQYRLNLEDYYE